MTWLEIYNAVVFRVWGASPVPEGAAAQLQGDEGIIGNIHHRIQQLKNYWFMEYDTTIALVDGTASYDLPVRFKELESGGLRCMDVTTNDYSTPLRGLLPGEFQSFSDYDEEADYPQYYEIWGDHLIVRPTPNQNSTLAMRCYRYLARPPAAFDATYDTLTDNGAEVIINMAAAETLEILEEFQKAQIFKGKAVEALELLNKEDMSRRRPEILQSKYEDL